MYFLDLDNEKEGWSVYAPNVPLVESPGLIHIGRYKRTRSSRAFIISFQFQEFGCYRDLLLVRARILLRPAR